MIVEVPPYDMNIHTSEPINSLDITFNQVHEYSEFFSSLSFLAGFKMGMLENDKYSHLPLWLYPPQGRYTCQVATHVNDMNYTDKAVRT